MAKAITTAKYDINGDNVCSCHLSMQLVNSGYLIALTLEYIGAIIAHLAEAEPMNKFINAVTRISNYQSNSCHSSIG